MIPGASDRGEFGITSPSAARPSSPHRPAWTSGPRPAWAAGPPPRPSGWLAGSACADTRRATPACSCGSPGPRTPRSPSAYRRRRRGRWARLGWGWCLSFASRRRRQAAWRRWAETPAGKRPAFRRATVTWASSARWRSTESRERRPAAETAARPVPPEAQACRSPRVPEAAATGPAEGRLTGCWWCRGLPALLERSGRGPPRLHLPATGSSPLPPSGRADVSTSGSDPFLWLLESSTLRRRLGSQAGPSHVRDPAKASACDNPPAWRGRFLLGMARCSTRGLRR